MLSFRSLWNACKDKIHIKDKLLVHGYVHFSLSRINAPVEIILIIFLIWIAVSYGDGTIFKRIRSTISDAWSEQTWSIDEWEREQIMNKSRDFLCDFPRILNFNEDYWFNEDKDKNQEAINNLFAVDIIGILYYIYLYLFILAHIFRFSFSWSNIIVNY